MCEPSIDLCFIAGTDYYTDIQILKEDDTPVDLLGSTVVSQLLETDTSPTEEIDLTVSITSPSEGKIRLSLNNAQTQSVLPIAEAQKSYVSDVLVNWAAGNKEVVLRVNYQVKQGRTR